MPRQTLIPSQLTSIALLFAPQRELINLFASQKNSFAPQKELICTTKQTYLLHTENLSALQRELICSMKKMCMIYKENLFAPQRALIVHMQRAYNPHALQRALAWCTENQGNGKVLEESKNSWSNAGLFSDWTTLEDILWQISKNAPKILFLVTKRYSFKQPCNSWWQLWYHCWQ